MCIFIQVPTESRGLKSPGVGTVGVHASSKVGAENQTRVLWKNIKCSYHRGISPSWLAFPYSHLHPNPSIMQTRFPRGDDSSPLKLKTPRGHL